MTQAGFARLFPCDYEAVVLDESPYDSPIPFAPSGQTYTGAGLYVKVTPRAGHPWVGAFAPGRSFRRALSGMYTWTNPELLLVVVKGQGYLVNVNNPHQPLWVDSGPITAVEQSPEHKVVLVLTPWKITAYSGSQPHWQTERLSVEGLELVSVHGPEIQVEADPGTPEAKRTAIDIKTGRIIQ